MSKVDCKLLVYDMFFNVIISGIIKLFNSKISIIYCRNKNIFFKFCRNKLDQVQPCQIFKKIKKTGNNHAHGFLYLYFLNISIYIYIFQT